MDLDTSATGSCGVRGENSPLDSVSLTPELLPGGKPSKSSVVLDLDTSTITSCRTPHCKKTRVLLHVSQLVSYYTPPHSMY